MLLPFSERFVGSAYPVAKLFCPWLRKLNAARRKRHAPMVTIGSLIGRSSKPPTTTTTMASRRACSTATRERLQSCGRSGPRGTIAANEFLIDPAHLAQVSPGHPSPGKKNKNYVVRAKQRDHRQASWHTQDGSRLGLVMFPSDSPPSLVWPLGRPARCGLDSSHKIH